MGGPGKKKPRRTCFMCNRDPNNIIESKRVESVKIKACPLHRRAAQEWVDRLDKNSKGD